MFSFLLFLHSLFRWFVVVSLIASICFAAVGYRRQLIFSGSMNLLRHWTATFAHIQLMIGIFLWTQSPCVKAFAKSKLQSQGDALFFGLIHISGMLLAIVLLTIGSAKAKRAGTDSAKYQTMLVWFSIALAIILVVVPWPFSPLASRPMFRMY